jgi:hypothetical protein
MTATSAHPASWSDRLMIRRFALALLACLPLSAAHANTFFTDQATPATGSFEWDNFTVTTNAVSDIPRCTLRIRRRAWASPR